MNFYGSADPVSGFWCRKMKAAQDKLKVGGLLLIFLGLTCGTTNSKGLSELMARCQSDRTEFKERVSVCSEIIASGSASKIEVATAYLNRGNAWSDNSEADRAIADYSEVIRLFPNKPQGYTNRANRWADVKEFDRALTDYNQALRVDPKFALAYNGRASVWREKGELDQSLGDLEQAIRLVPKDATFFANRGDTWRMKGDLHRALADVNTAIALLPRAALFLTYRGRISRYLGNFDRAISDFNEALKMTPDFVMAFAERGLTYEKQNEIARAREDFEKALTLPPANYDSSRAAQETARAQLSALNSSAAPPVIPVSLPKARSETSIPTPTISPPTLSAATQATVSKGERRVALVIGNSNYLNVSPLANPKKDAEIIAVSLRSIGFESVVLTNDATREKLVESLRAFAELADQADWALVYYAGHGIEMNGQNYLIPVDARLSFDRDVQFETVPVGQVLGALEGAKKLRIVLLDACRNNPFVQQIKKTEQSAAPVAADRSLDEPSSTTRSIGRGLAKMEVKTGATLVGFAAKDGQTALDGEGPNSPFAVAMVQRIATPGVEINKVFRLVRDDVMEATAGRQEPYTYGSLPGSVDFFFVPAR
jgi:tetratricopeptide (TPR) repeat protein